ncbi:hypothetical protein CHUAL_013275 [Chamberlinius hualienensis]
MKNLQLFIVICCIGICLAASLQNAGLREKRRFDWRRIRNGAGIVLSMAEQGLNIANLIKSLKGDERQKRTLPFVPNLPEPVYIADADDAGDHGYNSLSANMADNNEFDAFKNNAFNDENY